jgi:hypothetical protein
LRIGNTANEMCDRIRRAAEQKIPAWVDCATTSRRSVGNRRTALVEVLPSTPHVPAHVTNHPTFGGWSASELWRTDGGGLHALNTNCPRFLAAVNTGGGSRVTRA